MYVYRYRILRRDLLCFARVYLAVHGQCARSLERFRAIGTFVPDLVSQIRWHCLRANQYTCGTVVATTRCHWLLLLLLLLHAGIRLYGIDWHCIHNVTAVAQAERLLLDDHLRIGSLMRYISIFLSLSLSLYI